jgi:maltose O-acetyltransferase
VALFKLAKLKKALVDETAGFNAKLYAVTIACRLLRGPEAPAKRAALLRLAGAAIGDRTRLEALPRMNGEAALFQNLTLGCECIIARDCSFDLEERITVGDRVRIGLAAMILTSTHELGPREHRAGQLIRRPVVVEDDVVLGSRSILLPGITVGAGAVIEEGAVVTQDVPAQTRVAGIPAVKVGR